MDRAELALLLGAPAGLAAEPRGAPSVVESSDPARFMASLARAAAEGGMVFLADPAWGAGERAQAAAIQSKIDQQKSENRRGWLCLPTGGTSGRLRFARHDEETLAAAVGGFSRHFGVARVNTIGVLPLHHVSGLMGWMRAALTGGTFVPWSGKDLEQGQCPDLPQGDWFLSLVPTQLQRLLGAAATVNWLHRFRAVLVGGGPVGTALLELAAVARLPLAPSYGMTETAAMVTALRPEEFLGGARSSGVAMPHAQVKIEADEVIRITGESLFRGYYPEWRSAGQQSRSFQTEDLGRLDAAGHLHVHGRRDAVIITGGEKVHAEEVEAALRATGEFAEVAVVGVADPQWGHRVIACYPGTIKPDFGKVERLICSQLSAPKRPKSFVALDAWPANAQNKVWRAELRRLVEERIRAGAADKAK